MQTQTHETSTVKRVIHLSLTLREVLRNLIRKNPNKEDSEMLESFRAVVRSDDKLITEVIDDFFNRHYLSITRQEMDSKQGIPTTQPHIQRQAFRQEVEEHKERMKEKLNNVIREKAKIILLDMVLPNGKALKDCTGKECRELAPTVGAWLERVGAETRMNGVVGKSLTEAQVQEIWQTVGNV